MAMDCVSFQLPALSTNDPLHQQKKELLAQKGLSLDFSVALNGTRAECELHFNAMLKTARVLNVNQIEGYFLEADYSGSISFRNELEALYLLMTTFFSIKNVNNAGKSIGIMIDLAMQRLEQLEANENIGLGILCNGDKEKRLLEWAQKEGIVSKLDIAVFEGYGRGGRAAVDIAVNDIVLKIPQRLIICEDTVLSTDVHQVLRDVEGVNKETEVLLWSMRERHKPDSKFEPYFTSLPKSFNTGLSFDVSALKVLDGTMVFEEILQSKQENAEGEVKAYEVLLSILSSMLDSLGDLVSDDEGGEKLTWDERLASTYKNQQRELLQSACDGCHLALKSLTS